MPHIVSVLIALEKLIGFLILARIIISFLPQIDSRHPLVKFIHQATEPLLAPFRAILPSTRLGIDFSPLLAMFTINISFRLLIMILAGV